MRALERFLAVLEAFLPALVVYYMAARALPVCTDPSCTRTRAGTSDLQADPAGTAANIGLALLLGVAVAALIWRHASDRRSWQLALMAVLIPVCGIGFVLVAFSPLSWTAGTLGAVLIPTVLIGSLNQILGGRRH